MNGGNGQPQFTDEQRAQAIAQAREIVGDILTAAEAAAALSDILEEIGEAVIEAGLNGDDEEAQYEAGMDMLEPQGDDSDALRVGLKWLIFACSGAEPERRKKRRKKP